ncbi:hypothetical protein JCM19045_1328 [Bacillus sp. JCM 19045]|nr:hypothetical protein JCM19045_1328 [Bacillus sp. JCM 19045]
MRKFEHGFDNSTKADLKTINPIKRINRFFVLILTDARSRACMRILIKLVGH